MMNILFFIKHFSWFNISITHFFLATELSKTLAKAYKDKNVFDYSVLEGQNKAFSWILYVDILILEVGGNLYDTVSIAVKAALHSTTIPRVKIATIDGGQPELEINDDPLDGYRLNVTQSPILVTMCRIGRFIGIKGSDAGTGGPGGPLAPS